MCGTYINNIETPVCNALPKNEEITYYNCEVGDLSGRFGSVMNYNDKLFVPATKISDRKCDPLITPDVVYERSIVFHCLDGKRAFCAPFILEIK